MSEKQEPGTALATRGQLGVVIRTPTDYQQYLAAHDAKRFNVLSATVDIGALPVMWSLVPSIVVIDQDLTVGEVYVDPLFCKGDEKAIAKPGLRKIAKAAGLSWETTEVQTGGEPYFWKMKTRITYMGHDGREKFAEGTSEYDLRDGSPRIRKLVQAAQKKGRDPKAQMESARMHGYRGCEARSINAAIREFGIKQKYTVAELAKPFVVFNMVLQPDMEDPAQKAAVLSAHLGAKGLLYGHEPPTRQLNPNHPDVIPGTVVGTFDATASVREPVELDDDVEPTTTEPPKGVLVTSVAQLDDDYFVVIEGGQKYHTSDRWVALVCNKAKKEERRIHIEPGAKNGDAIEILEVGGGEKL